MSGSSSRDSNSKPDSIQNENSLHRETQNQNQIVKQDEYQILSERFNPFNIVPPSDRLVRPPVHSIPLEHYEVSKKPMKLTRHKTQYYIVPVTHNSFHSYNLVNKVTKMVNPDYIAVELASLDDIDQAKLIAKEQALACQLAEFSGRTLLFIDRPIEYTRHSEKTHWEHSRIRAIISNLWSSRPISKDDADYLFFFVKYSLPKLIASVSPFLGKSLRFGQKNDLQSGKLDYHDEFDRLLEVGIFDAFYSEREQYMVNKLREVADEEPDKDQVVVAVVGQLHLPHLKFYWERNDLLSVDDLCSFAAPKSVVPIYTFQVYFAMYMTVVLWYRSFHFYKMPTFERPKYRAPITFLATGSWTLLQTLPAMTTYPTQGTVGLISSALIYTSYNRLRAWGYRRVTAFGITSLPVLGYGLMKGYKMKKIYDRAQKSG